MLGHERNRYKFPSKDEKLLWPKRLRNVEYDFCDYKEFLMKKRGSQGQQYWSELMGNFEYCAGWLASFPTIEFT